VTRRHKKDDTEAALANFALTFAKALLVFCVVMFVMISPQQKKDDGIKPKAEYIISVTWPVDLDYDVDVWVRDPDDKVVWYGGKEKDFLNLERDDLGASKMQVTLSGTVVTASVAEEIVTVRGFKEGEYVINVHLYRAGRSYKENDAIKPALVHTKITRMNPSVAVIYETDTVLNTVRQESHVVRFSMAQDGRLSNFTKARPVSLREKLEKQ
jgi:hypothetical protein